MSVFDFLDVPPRGRAWLQPVGFVWALAYLALLVWHEPDNKWVALIGYGAPISCLLLLFGRYRSGEFFAFALLGVATCGAVRTIFFEPPAETKEASLAISFVLLFICSPFLLAGAIAKAKRERRSNTEKAGTPGA
jgi:hypothetical protein